jgi:hypothetical protein
MFSHVELKPELREILNSFLRQSVTMTSIIVVGCAELLIRNIRDEASKLEVSGDYGTFLLRFASEGELGLLVAEQKSIPEYKGPDQIALVHELFHGQRQPPDKAGHCLIILTESVLNDFNGSLTADRGFCAVVVIVRSETNAEHRDKVWRIQRALFDSGFIGIGCIAIADGNAFCFLASETIQSVCRLGLPSRGQVSMSSLGSNGRFANQLFQYAYVRFYALRHGLDAAFPPWEGQELFMLDDQSCDGLGLPELRFGPFNDDDRMLWDRDRPPIDIDLRGYFQEIPRCWAQHRAFIRRIFTIRQEYARAIDAWYRKQTLGGRRTLVAIHIRRGDYRDFQNRPDLPWFRLVPEEWYLQWLRSIWQTLREPILYVATDEPDSIVPVFGEFEPIPSVVSAPRHIWDFEILRRADYLAICNSSFSRMASILASPTQKCFYPSFEARGFAPYEPWVDSNFWDRFAGRPSMRHRIRKAARKIFTFFRRGKFRL